MHIIRKQQTDTVDGIIKTLTNNDRLALLRCFVTHSANTDESAKAQATLATAHHHKAWLGCDCKPGESHLFVRKLPHVEATFTLVRPQQGSPYSHLPSCPFHSVTPKLHDEILQITPLVPQPDSSNSSQDTTALMQRLLLWILREGNVLTFERSHMEHYFKKLKAMCDYLKHQPDIDGCTLHEIICTHDKYLVSFYNRLRKLEFSKGQRKQGYFLNLATSINEGTIELANGNELVIEGPIEKIQSDNGPCWVLVLIAESRPGFFELQRAVSWPVYSIERPILISSAAERDLVRQLISTALYSYEQGKTLSFTKSFKRGRPSKGFSVYSEQVMMKVYASSNRSMQNTNETIAMLDSFDNFRDFRAHIMTTLNL